MKHKTNSQVSYRGCTFTVQHYLSDGTLSLKPLNKNLPDVVVSTHELPKVKALQHYQRNKQKVRLND